MSEVHNITMIERVLRHGLGWALVIAVLMVPVTPPWLAIVAIYPILTAILGWDPVYSAYQEMTPKPRTRVVFEHRHAM